MKNRKRSRAESAVYAVLTAAFWLLVLAVVLGVRLLIVGGEWGCVLADDPQLCMAVQGVNR